MSSTGYSTTYRSQARLIPTKAMLVWAVFLVVSLLYLPWVVDQKSFFGVALSQHALLDINMSAINIALIMMVGALGLNFLTGYTGLISIGNAGFFALGAMVAATFGGTHLGWPSLPLPLVMVIAGVAGGVVGALVGLPSYRIRGIYLLLATLSLQFIMVWLFYKFQVKWYGLGGISFLTPPSFFGVQINTEIRWYYLLLGTAFISFLLIKNLLRTRQGRAFMAVRDHSIAAAMTGINVPLMRVLSFAISSAMITSIGVVYAWYLGAASADNYTLSLAIGFIAMIIIGGEGSLVGTVLGVLVWSLMPNVLTSFGEMAGGISSGTHDTIVKWQPQITNIIFGVLIVVVMVFNPTGLAGLWKALKRFFVRWPYSV